MYPPLKPPDRVKPPVLTRKTRIRIIDGEQTLGIIWTYPDATDHDIRQLIPAGYRAMVTRNIWP